MNQGREFCEDVLGRRLQLLVLLIKAGASRIKNKLINYDYRSITSNNHVKPDYLIKIILLNLIKNIILQSRKTFGDKKVTFYSSQSFIF